MLPMDSKCSLNSMKGGSCGACAWALEARLLPANRPLKTRIVLIDNPSIYATCGMCEARFTLLVGNNRLVGVEEYFIQTARVGHGTKRVRNGKKKKGKTQTGSVIHEFIVYGCFGSCRLLGKKKKACLLPALVYVVHFKQVFPGYSSFTSLGCPFLQYSDWLSLDKQSRHEAGLVGWLDCLDVMLVVFLR